MNEIQHKKYHLVYFHSEGPPYDDSEDLSYCREKLIEVHQEHFDNIMFYTPTMMKKLGYSDTVREFEVTGMNLYYASMCKIGLSAWKPQILLLELDKLNFGDILIYRDANYKKYNQLLITKNIRSLAEECLESAGFDVFISRESLEIKLGEVCKGVVMKELGGENMKFVENMPLLICNFIVIKKSSESINFLKTWNESCKVDRYLDGHDHGVPHSKYWRNFNTNEQSIVNVLIARGIQKGYIPRKYPRIGFLNRQIDNMVYWEDQSSEAYEYLKYLDGEKI